jgi:hypothetical protein
MQTPTSTGVIASAGCDALLGALISWNALIIQHYFRKAIPEDEVKAVTTPTTPTTPTT